MSCASPIHFRRRIPLQPIWRRLLRSLVAPPRHPRRRLIIGSSAMAGSKSGPYACSVRGSRSSLRVRRHSATCASPRTMTTISGRASSTSTRRIARFWNSPGAWSAFLKAPLWMSMIAPIARSSSWYRLVRKCLRRASCRLSHAAWLFFGVRRRLWARCTPVLRRRTGRLRPGCSAGIRM